MINQFQQHLVIALWTKQRVFSKAIEETLLKRFGRQYSVASMVGGHIIGNDLTDEFPHFLISDISMEAVITNSLKALWQNVLNHSSNELQDGEGFMLNLSCFMIPVPVADSFSVISFNPANRDRWRDDILCQILSQPLSARWHFAGLKESDKTFGIIFPCPVNVLFNGGIGNILPEHFQEMVLPFSVHHVVWDIRDILPLFQRINSTCGHEDMKVGVVVAGTSCGLQNNNVTHVKSGTTAGVENIFETVITGSHEWAEQCGVTIKPCSQELRHGQYDMAISYAWQQPPPDEIGPSVGVAFCTGKAEAGFAGESDTPYLAALATSVLDKAHLFGGAAVKHFLYGIVVIRTVKVWIGLLKRIPMIVENLFECVFVDAFHGCSLRATITELAK